MVYKDPFLTYLLASVPSILTFRYIQIMCNKYIFRLWSLKSDIEGSNRDTIVPSATTMDGHTHHTHSYAFNYGWVHENTAYPFNVATMDGWSMSRRIGTYTFNPSCGAPTPKKSHVQRWFNTHKVNLSNIPYATHHVTVKRWIWASQTTFWKARWKTYKSSLGIIRWIPRLPNNQTWASGADWTPNICTPKIWKPEQVFGRL